MSYAAEPYVQFVDDLLTSLTGGVTREEFRFLDEEKPFKLRTPGPLIPSTVRVFGQAGAEFHRFQTGRDYKVEPDGTITWLTNGDRPAAGATWPDDGTKFYVNYEYSRTAGANPLLTDRNPGSVTRLLAESFGREYAVFSRQLEGIYKSAFVETATGLDLDQIGLLVGIERRTSTFAIGSVVFSRSTPAQGDITVPAGTKLTTATPPVAQFETETEVTLRRSEVSVEAPIKALVAGPGGVVEADAILVMNRPIQGLETVTNPQRTGFQSSAETDAQLRGRIQRAHQGSGQATTKALVAALTTIPGLREKDIQILEDPIALPGVIELNVALPELPPGRETEMFKQFTDQAVDLVEQARPVGVRIVHNIDAPAPTGPGEPGPGLGGDEGDSPVSTGRPPTGSLSLPIDVNVWLTPATRGLTSAQQNDLIQLGTQTVHDYLADAGIGETLVYNRLVTLLMALAGVIDVGLEMYPQSSPEGPRRKNILPVNPSLRPVAGKIDVQLGGSLIVLDIVMAVTRKTAGLLVDPLQMSTTISTDVLATLNERFRANSLPLLNPSTLQSTLSVAETYNIDKLDYSVEYQDAGVRVLQKNPEIQPSISDQFWVRRVTVEVQ